MRRVLGVFVRLAVVAAVVLAAAPGADAATTSGPSVTVDEATVHIGTRVHLRIAGFQSTFVTISTCGNQARRGSVDCNLVASQGLRLDADGGSRDEITVAEPPATCPCVIRVANQTNDEVATVAIDVVDHPTGPLVDPALPGDAVTLAVKVREDASGVIDGMRAWVGGAARYAVTVRVTNRTPVPLRNVALFGSVGRGAADEMATIDIPKPEVIQPGQTWEQQVFARVPSPTVGSFTFRVSATGAGPTVSAVAAVRHPTPLLLVAVALLVVELAFVATRWLTRRRAARAEKVDVLLPGDPAAA